MRLSTFVTSTFFTSMAIVLFGAYLKITHTEMADSWLLAGLLVTIAFVIGSLVEIWRSVHKSQFEKIMWTIAFIFMSGITGIAYMIFGRRDLPEGKAAV